MEIYCILVLVLTLQCLIFANIQYEQSDDKRICIVVYDTRLLMNSGYFRPDVVDCNASTLKDSIKQYEQVRCSCYGNNMQELRPNAIKFIWYDRRIITGMAFSYY